MGPSFTGRGGQGLSCNEYKDVQSYNIFISFQISVCLSVYLFVCLFVFGCFSETFTLAVQSSLFSQTKKSCLLHKFARLYSMVVSRQSTKEVIFVTSIRITNMFTKRCHIMSMVFSMYRKKVFG